MAFHITEGVRWLYGPVGFPHHRGDLEDLVISPRQQSEIERQFGIIAVIKRYDSVGICAGPTYTRQCRHALARTRSTPSDRHTPSDRQVPFGRRGTSRLTRYTLSDRRGLRRQEIYFHGGCSGEAPGALAGRLVRSILPTTPRPSTAIVQVGRTSARPRARPWPHATGRHPFALPKPRSPTHQPRDSVGSMGARSGRCGQRRPCGCS